jgi:hypothetical protein
MFQISHYASRLITSQDLAALYLAIFFARDISLILCADRSSSGLFIFTIFWHSLLKQKYLSRFFIAFDDEFPLISFSSYEFLLYQALHEIADIEHLLISIISRITGSLI